MRGGGSRLLMANPGSGDKCAPATAASRDRVCLSMALPSGSARSFAGACPGQWQKTRSLLRLGGGLLLAFRHELLALLAVDGLGIGFLGAFERRGGARLRGLLFRRRGFRRRRGSGRRWWRGLREGGAHQQQGRE